MAGLLLDIGCFGGVWMELVGDGLPLYPSTRKNFHLKPKEGRFVVAWREGKEKRELSNWMPMTRKREQWNFQSLSRCVSVDAGRWTLSKVCVVLLVSVGSK